MAGKTIGIDGCKGKWIAVMLDNDRYEVDKYATISDVVDRYPDGDMYLMDMPMGLATDAVQHRPDMDVRKLLGKRGSTIFQVPCRQAVYATSKQEARKWNIEVYGKSLSEQSLGIAKGIRQVDEFLNANPQWKNQLHEAHPEFTFMMLNQGVPLMSKKTTPEGQEERLALLEQYFPASREVTRRYLEAVPARKKIDDVIDALCLAVMGQRIMINGMRKIPEKPEKDLNGIEMKIAYANQSKEDV